MNKRIAVYNNEQPEGPYYVIVLDWAWWRENWPRISDWFDRTCPESKPDPEQVMFNFDTDQYTMWRMVWQKF